MAEIAQICYAAIILRNKNFCDFRDFCGTIKTNNKYL